MHEDKLLKLRDLRIYPENSFSRATLVPSVTSFSDPLSNKESVAKELNFEAKS